MNSNDYDKLVTALQKRFQLTEDGYRTKFRTTRPEKGETPTQFVARLSEYFHRWVELSRIWKTYDSLVDLLLREQFVVSCSKELTAYLKERPSTSIDELADLAERYTASPIMEKARMDDSREVMINHRTKLKRTYNLPSVSQIKKIPNFKVGDVALFVIPRPI